MLVGRPSEVEQLHALIDAARRGRGGALRLSGEPGIGKSALLDEARRLASDLRRLEVTGVETESELPFASLDFVLRPILGKLDAIPETQARAVRIALALEEGEVDAFAVGAGTLSLLAEASDEAPILLLLDDAQWLDNASANALAFAARRVTEESVAIFVACREGQDTPFDALPSLALAPLGPADARALVGTRDDRVAGADVESVVAAAGGNPLALLELSGAAARLLPTGATVAERLHRAFAHRIDELSDESRRALVVAALEPGLDIFLPAASALGLGAEPLAAVEEHGLVHVEHGEVRFRHPVVRSVIYASASESERRDVHEALAGVLVEPPSADRRAWHLAGAAETSDESIAALLEETAKHAAARGGQLAEARALERAAELSPESAARARRLYVASRATFWAGDATRALALAEQGLPLADDPLLHADLVVQVSAIVEWQGGGAPEPPLLRELDVAELDDERRSKLLFEVAKLRLDAFDAAGALALAPRLEQHARGAGDWWGPRGLAGAAAAYLTAGARDDATRLFRELVSHPAMPAGFAFDYLALEWFDELRSSLDVTLRDGRADGNMLRVVWNQSCLAHLEVRLGRLVAAEAAAAEAIPIGDAIGTPTLVGVAMGALAHVHAWRGHVDACVGAARSALDAAHHAADVYQQHIARHALALLALGQGRAEDAVADLEPAVRRWARSSVAEPNTVLFLPDYAEALAASGEPEEAASWLERYRVIAADAERVGPLAAIDRVTALLEPDRFEQHFEQALARLESSPLVLDRARTRLNYGERLRRAGRRRDARAQLRAAYDEFATAGAELWLGRAASELHALGDAVQQRGADVPDLTPQERHVAGLVAEGKTNKEIAAVMYVSPKTVNYHLTNTFRKLGIHSRAELARVVAGATEPESGYTASPP
jgi:DNA-binding CsgD family transcriptional regulator